ncbi:bacterioferritin [Bacteroidota bacterium]
MQNKETEPGLIRLLNKAIAREMQVSIQYMLQHSIINALEAAESNGALSSKKIKFIGSHSPTWLPGLNLKKIAITEMRHAESITERLVNLGGEPTTQPDVIMIGESLKEVLEIDREQERSAIELYEQIISVAEKEHDDVTLNMFKRILSDEISHHQAFSKLLEIN